MSNASELLNDVALAAGGAVSWWAECRRRRRPAAAAHVLLRRLCRWGLEDRRWCDDLAEHVRWVSSRRASVGAIAVAESDPNVVYAGMGESTIRGNVSHGDGVYRSDDGGATWRQCGLAADAAHRAGPGPSDGPEPGLRRGARPRVRADTRSAASSARRDGGATWEQVLYRDENTGAVRPGHGRPEPARALRRPLGGAPRAVATGQRRRGERHLQDRPTAATPGRS